MKKLLPEAVVLCAIVMVASYAFAQTWTKTSDSSPYVALGIASSADGKIIMAVGSGNSVISTDSGATWTTNSPDTNSPEAIGGTCAAMSADGTTLINTYWDSSGVFVSTNSGHSWNPAILPQGNWKACASSAGGSKLVAAIDGGLIYTSTNFGTTWLTNNAPARAWESIASSADGTKLAAVAYNDKIYTSTNSGLTWTPTIAPSNPWWSIASSADGNHLAATGDSGTYISTNSGNAWTPYSIIGYGVASSADGSKLIICDRGNAYGQGSLIYTSTNFGINWASTNIITGRQWYSVASSADGCRLMAGNNEGEIWIYQATPSPELTLAPASNNFLISWPVPSTNFVLQQSRDLISWSSVTDTPTLNLTNLNNTLSVSPSNSIGFFRLVTP